MLSYKSLLDMEKLASALKQLPVVVDGSGVLMANGQFRSPNDGWGQVIWTAIHEIERLQMAQCLYVMANTILPGKKTVIHVDPLPQGRKLSRWHLPVETNLDAWFETTGCHDRDANMVRDHLTQGRWHGPIKYWHHHAVGNDGTTPRLHFIVDLDLDEA